MMNFLVLIGIQMIWVGEIGIRLLLLEMQKLIGVILILRTMLINKLLKFKDFSEDLKCLHQLQL